MYNVATRHVVDPVDDFIESAANKVMQIHCAVPPIKGDVLVFMPGTLSPWVTAQSETDQQDRTKLRPVSSCSNEPQRNCHMKLWM
jgi:hypothetical protein